MLIAVLVVIWVAALAPMAFRRYLDRRASTSVDRFSYRTWLFRRNYPSLSQTTAAEPERVARRVVSDGQLRAERLRVRRRRERRRRVLLGLGGAFVATLVFGAIPPLRVFWDLSVVLALLVAGFLVLAASATRNEALTLERLRKVVPIQTEPAPISEPTQRVAVSGRHHVGVVPMMPRPAFRLVEAPSS